MLTRRRFIAISAALAPSLTLAEPRLHVETGTALGARVTLRLDHPDAPRLAAMAMQEIHRLERVFSLYLPDSALATLNRDGRLEAPPFELLECLALAGAERRIAQADQCRVEIEIGLLRNMHARSITGGRCKKQILAVAPANAGA